MPCFAPNGKEMTAGQAMANGCTFVMKEKKDPYSQSIVRVNKSRRNRKNTRKNRKNRKNTRRNRKNNMRR